MTHYADIAGGADAVEEMLGARHTTMLAPSLFPSNSETT